LNIIILKPAKEFGRNMPADSAIQYVSFSLAEETYAYEVKLVREIITYREPTPVPGSNPEIAGILNVRGEIVPVLSAEKHIQVSTAEAHQRILILDSSRGAAGIAVEQVGEIFLVEPSKINIEADSSKNVVGTVLHRDNLVILLEGL
ncbi:chemotaxis protein CheW, partial [Oleiphilus sp. HI0132]|uniref:chemotaxis protein CheW n=1 Tax=Oleiphilus sp. HI0132 TaxID=1822270 RepID=UPI001E33FBD0